MSEVSSDSKVRHIHKQTFCKRFFFLMKNIDLKEKKIVSKGIN